MADMRAVREALLRAPRSEDKQGMKRAAVAAILSPSGRLWFMRRSARKGDPWSGHISFPGGREEPSDHDLLASAIRETHEEVGLVLTRDACLGRLDDLVSRPVRSLMVRPFVFEIDHEPVFTLNHEVVSMHSYRLDALLAGEGRATMRWPTSRVGMRLPCVDFDGVRLWGMTLQMVDDLLHRLDGRGKGLARNR